MRRNRFGSSKRRQKKDFSALTLLTFTYFLVNISHNELVPAGALLNVCVCECVLLLESRLLCVFGLFGSLCKSFGVFFGGGVEIMLHR